jgi:hypothetical protein
MLFTELVWGPLFTSPLVLPLSLNVRLCDLRSRFLAKGRVGRGYRAIARNGRVLFAADHPLAEWVNRPAQVRLQPWHRAILQGDRAEPYGILLCVRTPPPSAPQANYTTRLVETPDASFALAVGVGGGLALEFRATSG